MKGGVGIWYGMILSNPQTNTSNIVRSKYQTKNKAVLVNSLPGSLIPLFHIEGGDAVEKEELLKLKQYKAWVNCYNSQLKEIDRLKRIVSGFSNAGSIISSLDEWKQSLIEKQTIWEQHRLSIIQAVEAIPDERYRTIIRLRYVEGKSWEQIPPLSNFSYSHVLTLHKQFWEKEGEKDESKH